MIEIREAIEDDVAGILSIYNDAILHTTAVYDYTPHTLEMRRQWFSLKKKQRWPVFVAIESGEVKGFSSVGPYREKDGYKYTVENSVYVAEGSQGKGIGKLLMQALIEWCKENEIHTIVAGIDATNEKSIKFHEKFGFIETAHLKEVGYKFGRWLDLKFLQLILETPLNPQET